MNFSFGFRFRGVSLAACARRFGALLASSPRKRLVLALLLALTTALLLSGLAEADVSVYVASSVGGSSIGQFNVDPLTGTLMPKSPATVNGGGAGIAITPDGTNAYFSGCGSGVCQFNINSTTGVLTPKDPASLTGGGSGLAVTPNGLSAYVANYGAGTISQFNIDPLNGTLTPKTPPTVASTSTEPYGVAVTPDGASAYVANYNASTISQYTINADGTLTPKTPTTVAAGMFPQDVSVTPNGKSAYVTNTSASSVSQYTINADGTLTPKMPATVAAGHLPRDVAVTPDGTSAYVANTASSSNSVSQYNINADGTLTPKTPASVAAGYTPTAVGVSFDGKSAYAASVTAQFDTSGLVNQYDINSTTGVLTPKSQATVSTVRSPGSIAVAPSQGHPRPRGASPLSASLVPAYQPCGTGNSTHGAPLSHPSCTPPAQASSFLTVGTPDANGAAAKAVGLVLLRSVVNPTPTPNDLLINVTTTDVRCKVPATTTCGNTNAVAGRDYAGQLQARETLRVTDNENGPSTIQDFNFTQAMPCSATTDSSVGASCSLATSANALMPGMAKSGERATWEFGQIQLYDGGPSGTAGGSSATLFEDQGVFVP
jgi:6-phosphogluconolactonase (cycloisomerase 2 family)